jgi:hypothetical protein
MAWHHTACWQEHGRCSTCQTESVLQRLCIAADCAAAVNDVVTEPYWVGNEYSRKDLRHLCAPHALRELDDEANRDSLALAIFSLLTLVFLAITVAELAGPVARSGGDLLGTLLLTVLSGGLTLFLGLKSGQPPELRQRLSQASP